MGLSSKISSAQSHSTNGLSSSRSSSSNLSSSSPQSHSNGSSSSRSSSSNLSSSSPQRHSTNGPSSSRSSSSNLSSSSPQSHSTNGSSSSRSSSSKKSGQAAADNDSDPSTPDLEIVSPSEDSEPETSSNVYIVSRPLEGGSGHSGPYSTPANSPPPVLSHWAVRVGNYVYQLLEEGGRIVYDTGSFRPTEWATELFVGETMMPRFRLVSHARMVLEEMPEAYDVVTNNCQTYATRLMASILEAPSRVEDSLLAVETVARRFVSWMNREGGLLWVILVAIL
ncbi:hypothetical protein R3P38DRAFT_3042221 [Favolaschia claudopus]|uniref:PPPDE domain-containing protein n=1 Tax=Favolaschia claudopus TaxID=2862362 RepID=A0AAW0A8G8_9AGAR